MLKTLAGIAVDQAKKVAIDYAANTAKDKFISSPSAAVRSVNKHAKETTKDTNDILGKYWPIIQAKVVEIVGSEFSDDESLEKAFTVAHGFMPAPVRLILSERRFVEFCMNKKSSFFPGADMEQESTGSGISHKGGEVPPVVSSNQANSNTARTVFSGRLSTNNHKYYENLVPELIAFCVVSNGVIQDSEIKMAVSVINSDEMIRNKKKAIENMAAYIRVNMTNKREAEDLYKLSLSTLTAKIAKLESTEEKVRVDMIIESMLSSVQEISVANSQSTADAMRGALA